MRQTPAATMGAGAPSCAAMGNASATVMLRGTSALARSAITGERNHGQTLDTVIVNSQTGAQGASLLVLLMQEILMFLSPQD